MNKQLLEKVLKKIEGYRDEMVEMMKMLIAIPAISPESGGDGEMEKAKAIEPFLKKYFDRVVECHAEDDRVSAGIRPNYIVTIKGQDASKTFWLMAHLDIVPAGDEKAWATPPFKGIVKDGRIYGRGSTDNNQAIVSSLFAVRALKDLGITPACNFGVLLVADEEEAMRLKGVKHILGKHKSCLSKNDLIVVPDWGTTDGTLVDVAEKTMLWLKVTTKGRQSHGSEPHKGINAHTAASHAVVMVDALKNKYNKSNPIFEYPLSSIEPTKREANVPNVNTIPGEDVTYFDCRLLPEVNIDDFVNDVKTIYTKVEEKFGVKTIIEIIDKTPSPATPADAPIVKAVQKAAAALFNKEVRPVGLGGSTVAGEFRGAGFDIAVYSHCNETVHQVDEYCDIEDLLKDTKVWAYIAMAGE